MSGLFPLHHWQSIGSNSTMDNVSDWNRSSNSGGRVVSGHSGSASPLSNQGQVSGASRSQSSFSVVPSSSTSPQNISKLSIYNQNGSGVSSEINNRSHHQNLQAHLNHEANQSLPCANLSLSMSDGVKDLSYPSRKFDCGRSSLMALVTSPQDKESHRDIHNGGAVLSTPSSYNGEVILKNVSTPRVMSHPPPEVSQTMGNPSVLSHGHDLKENNVQVSEAKTNPNSSDITCKTSVSSEPLTLGTSDAHVSSRSFSKAAIDSRLCDNTVLKAEEVERSSPVLRSSQSTGSSDSKSKQEFDCKETNKLLSSPLSSGVVKQDVHDVESQMEALFAGIADEGKNEIESNSHAEVSNESEGTPNIAAVLESKSINLRKGKGKAANGMPKAGETIFGTSSTESTPRKKRKKKPVKDRPWGEGRSKKSKKGGPGKGKFVKEISCDNGSVTSLSRTRSPMIHVEGPKEAPTLVTLVNASSRLDDEENEYRKKNAVVSRVRKIHSSEVSGAGLCGSSLISRYEAHSNDPRWVCVFCKKGCHVNGLGDLFGPYLVKQDHEINHSDSEINMRPADKKNKRSGFGQTGVQGLLPIPPLPNEPLQYMVWIHEDCAVWAAGVHLIGSRLIGLQDAVWMAVNTKCVRCNVDGATLGCHQHGCNKRAHFQCAVDDGWTLNEELFVSTCHMHNVNKVKL